MQTPKRIVQTCLAGILLGAALTSQALAQGRPSPPAPGKPEPALKAEVKTDKKQYGVNDAIKLTLTVKNTTKETILLRFSSSQKFDFEIKRGAAPAGETVWQWARNMMFAQMMMSTRLEAGKSLTFTETYKPGAKAGDGTALPPLTAGTYTAVGTLTSVGNTPRMHTAADFTVK